MFWLALGLVVGAVFVYFVMGQASGKFHIRWYQWLLAIGAAALYLLAIQNYLGFQEELEPGFANLMLVMMGVPAIILTALIWITPRVLGGKGKQPTARMTQFVAVQFLPGRGRGDGWERQSLSPEQYAG